MPKQKGKELLRCIDEMMVVKCAEDDVVFVDGEHLFVNVL